MRVHNKIHRLSSSIEYSTIFQCALHILRVNSYGQMAIVLENLLSVDLYDLSAPVGLSHLISC